MSIELDTPCRTARSGRILVLDGPGPAAERLTAAL